MLGGVVGALLGVFGSVQGVWGVEMIFLFAAFGWVVAAAFPGVVSMISGTAARTLYNPSGRSTPRRTEYSLAESLAARGMYEDGIAAFQQAIAEDPDEPTPYLKIARICRDKTRELDRAATWFKKALEVAGMSPGVATRTRRELVELYMKMGEPTRAAPLLARTAEEQAGTAEGDWAAEELVRVKAMMGGSRPE